MEVRFSTGKDDAAILFSLKVPEVMKMEGLCTLS